MTIWSNDQDKGMFVQRRQVCAELCTRGLRSLISAQVYVWPNLLCVPVKGNYLSTGVTILVTPSLLCYNATATTATDYSENPKNENMCRDLNPV